MRLAIITTHPIQYYAPVFKLLAQKVDLMVFYTWGQASLSKHDPGFGKNITWDIDLLSGYNYQWVDNKAADPGSHHFTGIDNPDLIEQIKAWQPDTLLVYGWAYKSHLQVLRHFKNKIPVLFRGDSVLLNKQPGLKNLFRNIYLRWVYSHIDYALYVGTNNKAYFKKYGLKYDQLIFAPHAVDNNRFGLPRNNESHQLRHELNIDQNDIIALYAGKFEDVKNLDLLLTAFINQDNTSMHLLMVGNGTNGIRLKTMATNSKMAGNIHFMDFANQSTMPVIYQAADIFCLPSVSETWGLAVNEAMACSKAILVSDKVGCAIDLVKPGINGYIHKADSVADLSEKLNLLALKSKHELEQMGEQSKQIINNWTMEIQANNIINYKK